MANGNQPPEQLPVLLGNHELLAALAEDRPVKVRPLAKASGRSFNAFYAAVRRGEVKSIRVGRAYRIPAHEARRVLGLDQQHAA